MTLDRRFPSVLEWQEGARRRVPKFAYEFLVGGIGEERGICANRSALQAVELLPHYIGDDFTPELGHSLFGQAFSAPFGVAPFGLDGLIWPRMVQHIAGAARRADIPIVMSSFATTTLEEVRALGGENAWFQLYVLKDREKNRSFVERAARAGYKTLVLTVDIPTVTRRRRDIRNGLSVPPAPNLRTYWEVLKRPAWAIETLRAGRPEFKTLLDYVPEGLSLAELGAYLAEETSCIVTIDRIREIRDLWKGRLIIKGILSETDAKHSFELGADGLWISNHGGRQLDAAPTPVSVLPGIRKAVGREIPIMVDSGVRDGLDVARMMALGADFVFLGRAFIYAVAAMGEKGADHAMFVLTEELRMTLGQIGCRRPSDLPAHLVAASE
ncbi:alpha-hydroxy acid oxidase [Coralliovum pocilloporae]|uniref:alpha-hydroxy acid oxidase n=1 Tax=Coralliovum pocilloporae TaxID=3066369 RepID=UPI003306D2F3